jgi:menaquinone-dependent protoporphyrinogen IX oxidase
MPNSLVVYGSKYGSTKEVAEAIAEGLGADVASATSQPDVRPYGLVVVGSPIYSGDYMPAVLEFIQVHKSDLAERKVAAFITAAADWETKPGLTGEEAGALTQQDYADGLADLAGGHVVASRGFGGRLDPERLDEHDRNMLDWFYRFLMREDFKGFDLIDTEAARRWGESLRDEVAD